MAGHGHGQVLRVLLVVGEVVRAAAKSELVSVSAGIFKQGRQDTAGDTPRPCLLQDEARERKGEKRPRRKKEGEDVKDAGREKGEATMEIKKGKAAGKKKGPEVGKKGCEKMN